MGAGCKAFHALRVGQRPMKNCYESPLSLCRTAALGGSILLFAPPGAAAPHIMRLLRKAAAGFSRRRPGCLEKLPVASSR